MQDLRFVKCLDPYVAHGNRTTTDVFVILVHINKNLQEGEDEWMFSLKGPEGSNRLEGIGIWEWGRRKQLQ